MTTQEVKKEMLSKIDSSEMSQNDYFDLVKEIDVFVNAVEKSKIQINDLEDIRKYFGFQKLFSKHYLKLAANKYFGQKCYLNEEDILKILTKHFNKNHKDIIKRFASKYSNSGEYFFHEQQIIDAFKFYASGFYNGEVKAYQSVK